MIYQEKQCLGATVAETSSITNINDCKNACDNDDNCNGFTFDKKFGKSIFCFDLYF